MALFTDTFAGADNTLVSTTTGWFIDGGFGTDVFRLDGSGNVKSGTYVEAGKRVLHDAGGNSHYIEAVVGAGFVDNPGKFSLTVSSAPGGGTSLGLNWGFGSLYISRNGSSVGISGGIPVAGDTLRMEYNADTTVALFKINGTTIASGTVAGVTNTPNAGLAIAYSGAGGIADVFRSVSIDTLAAADTTAPTLTSATGTATSGTTATGSVSTDEANGTLYRLASTNATETAATVIAAALSQTVTATGVQSVSFTGLTPGATYYAHYVHTDAASNQSALVSSASFTTPAPDTENPVLTGSITVGAKTSSTIALSWPTATDNVGVVGYEIRVTLGAWIDLGLVTSHTLTVLAALTSYDIDIRAYDAAGLRSNILSVTTSTYRAGALGSTILLTTGPVDGNPAGILHNDVVSPGDDAKWFSFVITTPPATGTLDIDPDGTFTFSGPSPETMFYQLEVDGANVGSPQLVELYDQETGDVTAPSLSSATGASTGATTASGTVSTNEDNGTLYWIATTNATELAATVKAGSSQSVVATGVQNVLVSSLTPVTGYYLHYVHRDAAGNDSTSVSSTVFTTDAAPVFSPAQDTLNSIISAKLRNLGYTGSLNDMLRAFYGGSGSLQDLERSWLIAQTGQTQGSNKDLWKRNLNDGGYSGEIQDMLRNFWNNY